MKRENCVLNQTSKPSLSIKLLTPFCLISSLLLGATSVSAQVIESRFCTAKGTVTNSAGVALPGVTVTLSNPDESNSTTTDANGNYIVSLGEVDIAYFCVVTPSKTGYSFSPVDSTFLPGRRSDRHIANFIGT
ncbi:hypothetical protein Cylst_5276 [Cylindrospermum stagnale PCC 7417]|uniref:Carboxypeptidase regulatory-like domain-containing protein n=1 Tax=Cylindrospermum stagnale PCC 7417 TaxID=56107 RepID=K9X4B3_9NOST|nr:carboxypeptidase-like regulatory domain-containing protein [Cylindrospermum stagnale]AFZ27308.1 hypothetical protein Cylst_5276 [Cylindrospermum stagnale PCC 7417]